MPRVLIVDDLPEIHTLLRMLLEPRGYQCDYAGSGPAALQRIAQQQYALVVADLSMKPMNGLELLRTIGTGSNAPPVILMSGYRSPENQTEAETLGAKAFLEKPFPLDLLAQKVEELAPLPQSNNSPTPGT